MQAALMLLAAILTSGPAEITDADAAIRATLDAQMAAWNRGDLEGFMDGYLRGAELVFTSSGNVRRGWDTTFRKYRERYGNAKETMGTLKFDNVEVHTLGADAAWVLGQWRLDYASGETEGGVFTLVMQKIDRQWRVVHDHTSVSSK